MATWKERASEVQSLIDQGLTNAQIGAHFGVSAKSVRNRLAELRASGDIKGRTIPASTNDSIDCADSAMKTYKTTIDISADGSHRSDRLLRMSEEQSKDVDYLLAAHGYDRNAWELVSARSNIWNVYSTADGVQTLYASKITVRPKVQGWNIDGLLKSIREGVEAITIDVPAVHLSEPRFLEVAIVDPHFGNSGYLLYRDTQRRVYNLLNSRRWSDVLFYAGNDMFHNDNFRGQTANGTQIEAVDMPMAWRDADMFYSVLIETALRQSNEVHIMYVKSNHDESFAWAFTQYLKAKYPQAIFDDAIQERKIHTFHNVFIGVTHGDKARKQLHNLFPVEFPSEWSQAKTRELHCGHLHVEDSKDVFGMMVRTLATRNKTDSWHAMNGFVGTHKRFQLFEYSREELECIYYV